METYTLGYKFRIYPNRTQENLIDSGYPLAIIAEFSDGKNSYTRKAVPLMTEKLLPCPFCGNDESVMVEKYGTPVGYRYRVVCPVCMATVDNGFRFITDS